MSKLPIDEFKQLRYNIFYKSGNYQSYTPVIKPRQYKNNPDLEFDKASGSFKKP